MAGCQFLHLGSYGRSPGAGQPRWSCISGVTAEGARAPNASNHIRYPAEPSVIYGVSPIEAGQLAIERADQAYDAHPRRRRKLRRDGVALLAGVVSYPWEQQALRDDPVDGDVYLLWRQMTLAWLRRQFGHHLKSVVEHRDERYRHLHFYVVPDLADDQRLNINFIHPGRYAKAMATAEGANKKCQERAYREGMRNWQDLFHHDVSVFFGHDRYGPCRQRVTRRQRQMETAMEAERRRMLDEIANESIETEQAARLRGWERYAAPYQALRADFMTLTDHHGAEMVRRKAAEAECEALRRRLAALDPVGGALSSGACEDAAQPETAHAADPSQADIHHSSNLAK